VADSPPGAVTKCREFVVFGVILLAAPAAASAQSLARFSFETAVSVDHLTNDSTTTRPEVVIDIAATVRLGGGWRFYARPWFRVPPTPGDEQAYLYEAALRYERPGSVSTRINLGYISSPIGLGMFDSYSASNPVIRPHLSYFVPMAPFNTGGPHVQSIASTYPLGAELTVSGGRWDARAAEVNTAPTRAFVLGDEANPRATPVFEAGAGITPRTGLRIGVSVAHGAYLTPAELTAPATGDRTVTMAGVEAEFAFGHTKLGGEWVRDRLTTSSSPAMSTEWFAQGMQTLSPRWFVAGRRERTASPVNTGGGFFAAQPYFDAAELTAGFRACREVTVRAGWTASRFYGQQTWKQQAGVSVVWARRWW
jgi:hypothetical protein